MATSRQKNGLRRVSRIGIGGVLNHSIFGETDMIKLLPTVMLALACAAPQALADNTSAPSFTLADAAGHPIGQLVAQ